MLMFKVDILWSEPVDLTILSRHACWLRERKIDTWMYTSYRLTLEKEKWNGHERRIANQPQSIPLRQYYQDKIPSDSSSRGVCYSHAYLFPRGPHKRQTLPLPSHAFSFYKYHDHGAKLWRYRKQSHTKLTLFTNYLNNLHQLSLFIMSDKCGNCDCADSSQCTYVTYTCFVHHVLLLCYS